MYYRRQWRGEARAVRSNESELRTLIGKIFRFLDYLRIWRRKAQHITTRRVIVNDNVYTVRVPRYAVRYVR